MSTPQVFSNNQKWVAEFIGTAFLLATVVGSGIMAEQLAGGNVALALLGNTLPTGGDTGGVDHHVGAHFRRPFQSCGFAGICAAQGIELAAMHNLCGVSGGWGHYWCLGSPRDV